MTCGSGTYIRALARDLGAALGVGGYCSALTRTAVGEFVLAESVTLEDLTPDEHLIEPIAAVRHLPTVTAKAEEARALAGGMRIALPAPTPDGEVAVIDAGGRLLAIAVACNDRGTLRSVKVFAAPAS